ncbi:hypothetical protein [Sediminibacterium soli]|uniref:hypothetical protein n=1 Tax=Sediminibacterium soli TaxID=2698829 RepID=UPI00137B8ED2|nr:hypothetical protein [Sediminibacterium soli]NCI45952.1 hypothetical protein [Sediminibacterium soli]
MKNMIVCLFLCLLAWGAGAQISGQAFASVKYRFTHINDTSQPGDPYTETMILLLGKQYSAYQSYDKMVRDSVGGKVFMVVRQNA